jgi:flagellar biosynthesis/type III secretory pathway M-ring protein FliF/YscJ
MESLQKLLSRTGRQLSGLSVSQRVALVLGAVLVAVSLAWITTWAATPEMTPLLPQNLAAEELASITAGLDALGVQHRVDGARVLVQSGTSRPAVIAQLQQMEKLPADTSTGFDALVKEANPWISQEENDRRWTVALQGEIERVLKQFAGVRHARVFLNLNARPRGFARNEQPASASVTLVMQSGEPVSRKLALAAASLVSGAVRGLPVKNVQVVDGQGASALDWDADEPGGSAALERQRRDIEKQLTQKIVGQLAFDPRVRVNVQVELDLTERATKSSTPTAPVDISETRTSEESTRVRGPAQPGVQPNVGVAAGAPAGSGDRTEINNSTVERVAGTTYKEDRTPSGGVKSAQAAINVSHTYLEHVFRLRNGADAKATPQQIEELFENEKPRIVAQVLAFVKPQKDEQVRVGWYYDAPAEADPPAEAGAVDSAFSLVRDYGPQAGLGLLGLLSLGLMLRMARRGNAGDAFGLELGLPREAIAAARAASDDIATAAVRSREAARRAAASAAIEAEMPRAGVTAAIPDDLAQAALTEGVLEAREIDQKTVQIRKMVEQVSRMVDNDEVAVSALLEKWVDTD